MLAFIFRLWNINIEKVHLSRRDEEWAVVGAERERQRERERRREREGEGESERERERENFTENAMLRSLSFGEVLR